MNSILEAASSLKYVKSAAAFLSNQLTSADDDFVRYIGRQIYDGSLTKAVVETLRPAIQSALDEVIRNRIQERLNVTFGTENANAESAQKKQQEEPPADDDVVTTEDELQAFMIVRAIGSKIVPVTRITMRDARSYCSVFVDNNNRKPVCRFYFNAKSVRSIGVFDAEKNEVKHQISDLSDIYKHADTLLLAIGAYA
jgi:hypothetical protein